ncbi:MAG TPA: hypothetical protein VEB59_03305 [Gemmatimonadales bacterium]|nr:hypothetical protein [Gemmatimonadales bacterium]
MLIFARMPRAALLSAVLAIPLAAQQPKSAPPVHLGLGAPAPVVRTEADLVRFLDDLELQRWVVDRALSLEGYAQWRGESHHQVAGIQRLSTDLASRRDYAMVIDQWKPRVKDPTLARRLQLHATFFLPAKADPALSLGLADLQTAIQDTVQQFRYRVAGRLLTRTQLSAVLDSSPDRPLRQAAFEAVPQVSERIGARVRQAMGMNDRIGRQQGFPNGAAARLAQSSLTPNQVLRDLDAFDQATRPTYDALLARMRKDLAVDHLEPWDLDHWFRVQERAVADAYPIDKGVERTLALARGLGFQVDSLPITVTIYDVPTGGIAFDIRPPYEARLLSNPFAGAQFYSTLFHEYGHTLHMTGIGADLPLVFLAMDEQPSTEGLAEVLGLFAYDRRFLARTAGVNPEQAAQLERLGKLQHLLWLRRTIAANAYAEVQAYLDLEADLDSIYAASYRRFVGVELPPGDYVGARDMFGTTPLYLPVYLYADMIGTQLQQAMRAEFGAEDLTQEPRVAGWMTTKFYGPGQSVPWPEKIRRATGKALDARALAAYLAVDVGK